MTRFEDVFESTTIDPIYQIDELSVKPILFGASPRTLITMFFLPQQPEPNYPHRLAIYLCVSLEPRQICQELRNALDEEFLNGIVPLPNDNEIEKPAELHYLTEREVDLSEIVVREQKILKSKKEGGLCDVHSEALAQQLTMFDCALLKELDLSECIDLKSKPTIDRYCEIIDNLGGWVGWVISQHEGSRAVKQMQYFIKVSYECMKINSFNMSYAIFVTVSHYSLSSILQKISFKISKRYEELKKLFDFSRNFTVYRNTFSLAPSPKSPILPLWLGDLIHSHSAFSNEDKFCRVDILRSIANNILSLKTIQKLPFTFEALLLDDLSRLFTRKFEF